MSALRDRVLLEATTRRPDRLPRSVEPARNVIIALTAAVVVVGALPVAFVVYRAVVPSVGMGSFTEAVREVFSRPSLVEALRNSLTIGICSAAIATFLATLIAWITYRTNAPLGRIWAVAMVSSFALPAVLAATAWTALLGPRAGFVNHAWNEWFGAGDLMNIRSLLGLIIVQALVYVPFGYLLVSGAFAKLSTDEEESARVHGCSLPGVLFRVTLPALGPAILSCYTVMFVFALQTLSVPVIIGYPAGIETIPASLYNGILGGGTMTPQESNVLGLLLLLPGLVAFALLIRYQRRERAVAGTGLHGSNRSGRLDLGRAKWPTAGAMLLFFAITLVLPVATIVLLSFVKYINPNLTADLFTLQNYREMLDQRNTSTAIVNSITIGLVAATVGTVLTVPLAYTISRARGKWLAFLDVLTTLPLVVPRLVLGLGVYWFVAAIPGLADSQTVLVLAGAVVVAFLGLGVRTVIAAFDRVGVQLDEAAWVAGAGLWDRILRILVPVVLPSLVSVWRTIFLLSLLTVDIVIFVYQSKSINLAVLTFLQLGGSLSTALFPLAVVQIGIATLVVSLTALAARLANRIAGSR